MAGPFISFLTDFGDTAPAVCRGVMWGIAPDARILDLTHQVRKFAVREGAFLLSRAVRYLPIGVHVAVVDPGVGTPRRPIAVSVARGDLLVGPDNGLLQPAAEVLGGIVTAHELTNPELFLSEVSWTFHGRDIFAPVAAYLAVGVPLERVGPAIEPADLTGLRLPDSTARDGGLDTAVLFIDSFGNARVAGQPDDLAGLGGSLLPGRWYRLNVADRSYDLVWAPTFGAVDPGGALLYDDADYGGLAIAVNQGSAAERFGLRQDTPVRLEPRD